MKTCRLPLKHRKSKSPLIKSRPATTMDIIKLGMTLGLSLNNKPMIGYVIGLPNDE